MKSTLTTPSPIYARLWTQWTGPVLILLWVSTAAWLALRQHNTFQTQLFDLGYYTQVVWNTANGRWFANSLKYTSFLTDHFSPILALLAPLFWAKADARILLLVQAGALGLAIYPNYLLVKSRQPTIAPLFVASLVLSLTLQRTALEEFHEIMLAAPLLATALYALWLPKPRLFALAMGLTLLVREDMGLYVATIGLYLLIFRPTQRWQGSVTLAIGVVWSLLTILLIMPAAKTGAYAHFNNPFLGGVSFADFGRNLLQDPRAFGATLFTADKGWAVAQLLLPLAIIPLLLGRGEQLLWLIPTLFLLVLPFSDVGALRAWYVAPLLPMMWGPTAVALANRPTPTQAHQLAGLLVICAAGSFALWSPFPGGGRFQSERYRLTRHHQIGQQVLETIPPTAAVVAQSALGAHLAARPELRLFPWFGDEPYTQWLVLDTASTHTYPLTVLELQTAVANLLADPTNTLYLEQDGFLILQTATPPAFTPLGSAAWEPWLALEGVEIAQTDGSGRYIRQPIAPHGGQTLRVALYWQARQPTPQNLSVSVFLAAPDGFVIAQDDAWPAQGLIGTVTLQPGQRFRDIHYLSLPAYELPPATAVGVLLYETTTGTRIPPPNGIVIHQFP